MIQFRWRSTLMTTCACVALSGQTPTIAAPLLANDASAISPIKHVLVIIGENRSFDHLFATYTAPSGEPVSNLLSKGIVNVDGTPGPNVALATQHIGNVPKTYSISPPLIGTYNYLPAENTGGTPSVRSDQYGPPFVTFAHAQSVDYGLLREDIHLLLTGATGLEQNAIDYRIKHPRSLPNGPFQLTPDIPYDSYSKYPTHRFYQMWQQLDCAVAHATPANPTGCNMDLFPWVEVSVGSGSGGTKRPSPFTVETTNEGATAMGFYNVAQGDAPYISSLAAKYTIADNYHQPVMGGTGPNSIMLGTGDMLWYSNGNGNPMPQPPTDQIEDPDPQPGTNNWYTQDGQGSGAYTDCSNALRHGVASIADYLAALPYHPSRNCETEHFYLLGNVHPGYHGNGAPYTDSPITLPPSSTPTIADVLLAHNVSWRYYGEGWNAEVQQVAGPYCAFCNPFQFEKAIMTNMAVRTTNLKDTLDLYNDIANQTLPAVAFVKPGELNDGHSETSKFDIFEAFLKKIMIQLQANPALANSTAVFITVDEGGGYYDSGYVQPLDYFGDGTRIPLIVVSPYTLGGHVNHTYGDHVSILKFIEKNWNLPTISNRSRDNLPNPIANASNPYLPTNGPAIGDLMDMFRF